jgi:hypothetical protein
MRAVILLGYTTIAQIDAIDSVYKNNLFAKK